jgi:hypothetical protein
MHGYPHHAYGIQLRETRRRPHGDKMFEAVCKLGLEGIFQRGLMRRTSLGHQRRG